LQLSNRWGPPQRTTKEYVVLEKGGLPVTALMDIDEFEDYLELQDSGARRHIAASAKEYAQGKSRSAEKFFKELEEEQRDETDRGQRRRRA
jgi:hypothetical protein